MATCEKHVKVTCTACGYVFTAFLTFTKEWKTIVAKFPCPNCKTVLVIKY